MIKTTVYLSESEAAALRQAAAQRGTSQAELIREGVRHVAGATPRNVFRSRGVGHSGAPADIEPDEFYDWVMGKR